MNRKLLVSIVASLVINFTVAPIYIAMAAAQSPEHLKQVKQLEQDSSKISSKKVLRAKLAKLHFFSAHFTQEVLSSSGELLDQSSGKLAISKPNLANWHTIEPDELAIVSDGSDVWFYNPWLEEVSVYSLSAAIAQTPILLLTSQDDNLWQRYDVIQQGNSFIISAKNINSQIKSLTLVFTSNDANAQLSQFSFLDATGQKSNIQLSDYDAKQSPDASLFNFVVPEGVQIDDQRVN